MLCTATLDLKTEKQSAHSDWILSVAYSPDGKTIVSGGNDKALKVWDSGETARVCNTTTVRSESNHVVHSYPGSQDGEAERPQ